MPIAVGAGDKWPSAHYWYNYALRACTPDTMVAAGASQDFSDPCFEDAGEQLAAFIATSPFQPDFLDAPAQTGDTSSAALLANGSAAMELMGHWHPGVMSGLVPDGAGLGETSAGSRSRSSTAVRGTPTRRSAAATASPARSTHRPRASTSSGTC